MKSPIPWLMSAIAVMAITSGMALGSDKATAPDKKPSARESSHGKATGGSDGHVPKTPAKATPVKTASGTGHGSGPSHGSSSTAAPAKPKTTTSGAGHGSSGAATSNHGPARPVPPASDSGHDVPATAPPEIVSGPDALKRLAEGNNRFVAGRSQHPNADAIRRAHTASNGQKPMATIVSCSDSRVPVEILFDAGIGDLFVVRVAGNVCDTDEIGTIEYGTEHLGTPLLLILGHTRCGAVTAVTRQEKVSGNIPKLVDNIVPAVTAARQAHPDLHGDALLPEVIKANVLQSIEDLLNNSEIVRHLVSSGRLKIEGAVYDLEKGTVQWLGKHPSEAALLAAGGGEHKTGAAAEPPDRATATPPSPATRPSESHADVPPDSDPGTISSQAPKTGNHASPTTQPSHELLAAPPTAADAATVASAGHPQPSATQPHADPPQAPDAGGSQVLGWTPTTRPAGRIHPSTPTAVAVAAATTPTTQPTTDRSTLTPSWTKSTPTPARTGPSAPLPHSGPGLLERTIADELYRQGAAHLVRGEDATAAERFRAALEADPHLLPALNDLAGICYLQRDYQQALELYSKVLAAEPAHESALRGAALTCASQQRYAESRDILQRLLTRNPSDAQIWLDFGDVQFLMGDMAGALNAWKKAAQVNPAATSLVANANQRLRRYEEFPASPNAALKSRREK